MTKPSLLDAELFLDARADLAEGPLWDRASNALVWVDIPRGQVHLTSATGDALGVHVIGRSVGAAMPAEGDGWLLAEKDGFTALAVDGTTTPVLPMLSASPDLRSNDAKCDPAGRAWAGTVAHGLTRGAGTLYRLDEGPIATPVLRGLSIANGLGWSPDGRTMWFADSAERAIWSFDYELETGTMGSRTAVIALQETAGDPDGLCVDDEGCVWVAVWGGSSVHRYTADGRIDTVVNVPAAQVTSCAFGGADLSTLFITTARQGRSPEELRDTPHAGGLFVVTPGVSGPAATPWRRLLPTGEAQR